MINLDCKIDGRTEEVKVEAASEGEKNLTKQELVTEMIGQLVDEFNCNH